MKAEIKKLSTNRFKINGVVYKRVKSSLDCKGCYFFKNNHCKISSGNYCYENINNIKKFYHLIPNEL